MRKRYGWEYGAPAYATASFVAYSRVESRKHYPHDMLAGAGIGILSSYIFTKPYKGWR
jgi:membrane-associated phospholipid phosphatase